MAADPHRPHLTVQEYLALDQSSPDAKYEYIDGVVYNLRDPQALASGTLAHARIAINLAAMCKHHLSPIPVRCPGPALGITVRLSRSHNQLRADQLARYYAS